MDLSQLDHRPVMIALAGPNGAGKTSFYYAHLQKAGLRLVNADRLAAELQLEAYTAARTADALRRTLVERRESFVFETVFSDPVGDKLAFMKQTVEAGYTVVLCFIGLDGSETSEQRVAMRVSQGGHDVPTVKLRSRYPRILSNLKAAIHDLPQVLVFDNSDLSQPCRIVATFEQGQLKESANPLPTWFQPLLEN